MTNLNLGSPGPANARRRNTLAVLRSLATTALLVASYYLLPLDHIHTVPLPLTVGLLVLICTSVLQLWAVTKSPYPRARATEALASTLPLFVLLFAGAYFLIAQTSPGSFTQPLTRTDALYFTVTIFSTVGFGDITAVSQTARVVVIVQMILDLLVLGLGLRVYVGAVRRGRERSRSDASNPG